jgi:hypothetical protein
LSLHALTPVTTTGTFVRGRFFVSSVWIAPGSPFVVQLLAEYVVEISESVLERLEELQPETYRRFAVANESFMRLTRNRIVSYWACYYRVGYRLPAYPPVRVLMELGLWNGAKADVGSRGAVIRRSDLLGMLVRHEAILPGHYWESRDPCVRHGRGSNGAGGYQPTGRRHPTGSQ